jgi:hypothetical protein
MHPLRLAHTHVVRAPEGAMIGTMTAVTLVDLDVAIDETNELDQNTIRRSSVSDVLLVLWEEVVDSHSQLRW